MRRTAFGKEVDLPDAHAEDGLSTRKTLIVIPTYNEKDNLPALLDALTGFPEQIHVLVVDDGSPDGTGDIAEQWSRRTDRVHLIRRAGKQGLGSAYVAGFRWALERDYERIFEMDADFSHDPKYVPGMLEASEDADVVIGSRYLTGVNVVNWPMSRLLLSWFANKYAKFVSGLPIHDCTAGFKCFRREVLEKIDLDRIAASGYGFQIELHYKAWKKGFKLAEVPIVFVDRRAGSSKMSGLIIREALLLVVRLRLGWT
jgi:dolichol-phosphate mannosyltransferase